MTGICFNIVREVNKNFVNAVSDKLMKQERQIYLKTKAAIWRNLYNQINESQNSIYLEIKKSL